VPIDLSLLQRLVRLGTRTTLLEHFLASRRISPRGDAIATLRDAALLEPSNAVIQHDLGLACLEVGRVPDAIAALQRAVATNPRYADAYFRLGIALEKLGDVRGAIVAYDCATKLLPSLTEAWFRAGDLVHILGHRDEAIGCFRRAAMSGGRTNFGRLGKARALLIEDRNQEAEQALRETLVADPADAIAYELLGNLLAEFGRFEPRATFIHCRRDAIDTALSIHQTHFHPILAFPTGGVELVAYFRDYRRLVDHWRNVLPADRFIEVEYEELTSAAEPVTRRIIAACGLEWHDSCLRPENNPRAVKTPSKWQARQPIYRTSVARWRRYEEWLGPLRALVDV
jgi:tetratricopeptide (TPR) repeat protein